MRISYVKQRSQEWHELRVGSIGGTGYGQVISGRKNRLIHTLLNEQLNGYAEPNDFVSDDMQFGIDNEEAARKLYSEKSGIEFKEVGLIHSDYSKIHHASPDGLNEEMGIALEVKCTPDGSIHIERFFDGPESKYLPQIENYFAVSDDVKEVHWVSYCPFRQERPLVIHIFKRENFVDAIAKGRSLIAKIENKLKENKELFTF